MSGDTHQPNQTRLREADAPEQDGADPTTAAPRDPTSQHHAQTLRSPPDSEPDELFKMRKPAHQRLLLLGVALVLLMLGAIYGVPYYAYVVSHEWTDNAVIEGHIVPLSPNVGGRILAVHVTDNQPVKEGELLVELDPRDYAIRLAQARAALQAARARQQAAESNVELTQVAASAGVQQALAGIEWAKAAVQTAGAQVAAAHSRFEQARAQVETALAHVEQARAQVMAAEAEATRADADVERLRDLYRRDQVARQEFDHATATARTARAQLTAARQRVAAAQAQVAEARAAQQVAVEIRRQAESQVAEAQARAGEAAARLAAARGEPHQVAVSRSQAELASAEVEQARAAVQQAELELSYTRIYAPEHGRVTRKIAEEGAYVQPGQTLMALVRDAVWVVANFKETQLTYMRPGQPAEIEVDAYPGVVFKGHVDSIQAGTGARFSLLPPENATGNFVKVVQRIPVKIVFHGPPDADQLLAPGMSAVPVVQVK